MIDHTKLRPWIIYPKRVLSEIVTGRDKYSGVYLFLVTTVESFLQAVFTAPTFKYLTKYIRAFYTDKIVQLSWIPGKVGMRVTRNLDVVHKIAKTVRPINYTGIMLKQYSGKSFVAPWTFELNRFNTYASNDEIKLTRLWREWLNYAEHLPENSGKDIAGLYPQRVCIFNVEDPDFANWARRLTRLGRTMDKGLPEWTALTFFWSPSYDILVKADFHPGEHIQRMIRVLPLLMKIARHGQAVLTDPAVADLIAPEMELVNDQTPEPDNSVVVTDDAIYPVPLPDSQGGVLPPPTTSKLDHRELKSAVIEQLVMSAGISPARREPLSKTAYDEVTRVLKEMPDNTDIPTALSKISENPLIKSELATAQQYQKQLQKQLQVQNEMEQQQSKVVVKDNGQDVNITEYWSATPAQPLELFVAPDDSIQYAEIKSNKVRAQSSHYTEKVLKSDIVTVMKSLNRDPDKPMYVRNLEITPANDPYNHLDEYKAELMDSERRIHHLNVLIPRATPEGYLYYGGTKKFLAKQYVGLPVVKKKPDEVQVTSWYNKTFLNRRGGRLNAETERLKKFFAKISAPGISSVTGNVSNLNGRKHVSLSFLDWSQSYMNLTIGKVWVNFDINRSEDKLRERNATAFAEWQEKNPNATIVALRTDGTEFYYYPHIENTPEDTLCRYNYATKQVTQLGEQDVSKFVLWLLREHSPELLKEVASTSVGKLFNYTIIRILRRKIPLIILLAYKDGLESVLNRYGIQYEFSHTRRNLDEEYKLNLNVVPFQDGYLYYKNTKLEHCLLMHGLQAMSTEEYPWNEMQQIVPYVDYFESAYGSRNISKGFKNFYDRFIEDNVAKLLEGLKLPTDFTGLMLHCNTLLKDNTHYAAIDPRQYRIRSTEIIAQALYQELSAAYNTYKTESATNRRAGPLSVRKDGVLRRLTESQNLEGLSLLSPIIELEAQDKCTFKGIGGINLDDSFTPEYRYYTKNMQGIFGYYSPISNQCGIARSLSYNALIKDTRGTLDINDKEKTATETLSLLELLNPFTATSSDYPRIAMLSTQNKHCTSTVRQTRALVCSGVQKAIPHIIGQDFAFKAQKAGVVEKIDTKNQAVILKYDDGTKGLIDIKPRLEKNVKSGFYVEIALTHSLKVGQKFQEREILAYDPNFFQPSSPMSGGPGSVEYTNGCLAKTALLSHASTFEDSLIISRHLAEDLAFYITNDKFVSLGKNSHVSQMVKIGDHVRASDPLITFENSFDEAEVNEVLKKLGTETGTEVLEMGRNTVKAKTSGKIADIRIYYNRPLEELSPTLQEIVKSSHASSQSRLKVMQGSKSSDILALSSSEQIQYDTLYGQTFDGVLIQFFISHLDVCGQGDKLAAQVALKGVVSIVTDDIETPLDRNDKPIDMIVGTLSFVNRMTSDFHKNLYCNKILVELKEQVKKILS